MKTDVAADLILRLIEILDLLDNSIHFVKENCTEKYSRIFEKALGK